MVSVFSPFDNPFKSIIKCLCILWNPEGHHVQPSDTIFEFKAQLATGNDFNAEHPARSLRFIQTRKRVVVRNRNGFQPDLAGKFYQFSGRTSAIGCRCMCM